MAAATPTHSPRKSLRPRRQGLPMGPMPVCTRKSPTAGPTAPEATSSRRGARQVPQPPRLAQHRSHRPRSSRPRSALRVLKAPAGRGRRSRRGTTPAGARRRARPPHASSCTPLNDMFPILARRRSPDAYARILFGCADLLCSCAWGRGRSPASPRAPPQGHLPALDGMRAAPYATPQRKLDKGDLPAGAPSVGCVGKVSLTPAARDSSADKYTP